MTGTAGDPETTRHQGQVAGGIVLAKVPLIPSPGRRGLRGGGYKEKGVF
jgi:hypothetical protein